ncbi:MAG: hydrolase [Candidatus Bathyarchaeia archaeon]
MPFTPFHLGLGLGLGLPLKRYLHAPTFLLANIILDVEPLLVICFRLEYPLHGYLHTFLLALPPGLILGYFAFLLERFLHLLYRFFLLEASDRLSLKSFLFGGTSGTGFHVLLDAPLYSDIKPFYPIIINPLYNPSLVLEIYSLCVWVGILGIAYYFGLTAFSIYRKLSKTKVKFN